MPENFSGNSGTPNKSRPCEGCDVEMANPRPEKRFCSKVCGRRFHRRNHHAENAYLSGGGHASYQATLTFTDARGEMVSIVGWGKSKSLAQVHAREQLAENYPGFAPVSEYRSTPDTIFRSLRVAL